MLTSVKVKGIDQYLEAANALKKKYDYLEFNVCGYCEEDYAREIGVAEKQGSIVYRGLVRDVLPYEAMSHCIVLPSYHPEGISNVLLEAAACARPIITTDHPGCRETVDDGVSGYLVRERDSQDLIDKMEKFLALEHTERVAMGVAGRKKIEREFNREIVIDCYMNAIFDAEKSVD